MAKHRWLFGLPLGLGAIIALSLFSGVGSAARQAVPTNTVEPRIEGQARVGERLTATRGTWTGNPTVYRYQWLSCSETGGGSDGSGCTALPEATNDDYVVRQRDAGRRLRVRVSATNADGITAATSNATARVQAPTQPPPAAAPENTSPPTISGTPSVGSTLTANPGTWTGNPTFAYQFRRCDADGGSCADISGATTRSYVASTADRGNTIRVRVVARSGNRSSVATSVPTAVIRAAAAPPPAAAPTGCPAGSDSIRADQISSPARLLIDRQAISPSVATASTTSITARFRVTACGGRPVQGMLVYVTAVPYNQFSVPPEATTGADGFAELRMNRLRGYPATPRQQLLVMFVRARKNGESLLGGISTRRLVSFPVNLRG